MAGPDWLRDEATQAIDALAFGEAVPMLTPNLEAAGAKVRYRELRAQLRLVAIVRFRAAAYGGVAKAQNDVAEKVGISTDTLRTWERRLREELGRLEVDRTIEFATNHATWVRQTIERQNRGVATEDDFEDRQLHEANYNAKALEAAVLEYRMVQKG